MVRPRNGWDDHRRLASGLARSAREHARRLQRYGDAGEAAGWHEVADANEAGAAEYRVLVRSHHTRNSRSTIRSRTGRSRR